VGCFTVLTGKQLSTSHLKANLELLGPETGEALSGEMSVTVYEGVLRKVESSSLLCPHPCTSRLSMSTFFEF